MSSLPERPNLGHLRKQAKELLRQYRAGDPAALAAFRQYLPAAKDKSATGLSSMPRPRPRPMRLRGNAMIAHKEHMNSEKRLGVRPVEFFPESETKFFTTRVAAQISFVTDAQGQVTGLVFHQNGYNSPATRVNQSVVEGYEAALEQRRKDNAPGPGTQQFIRGYIVGCEKGEPNYADMSTLLAAAVRRIQATNIAERHQRVGTFKTLAFKSVDRRGWDVYEATFTLGQVEYRIAPLTADGKAVSIAPRELP